MANKGNVTHSSNLGVLARRPFVWWGGGGGTNQQHVALVSGPLDHWTIFIFLIRIKSSGYMNNVAWLPYLILDCYKTQSDICMRAQNKYYKVLAMDPLLNCLPISESKLAEMSGCKSLPKACNRGVAPRCTFPSASVIYLQKPFQYIKYVSKNKIENILYFDFWIY